MNFRWVLEVVYENFTFRWYCELFLGNCRASGSFSSYWHEFNSWWKCTKGNIKCITYHEVKNVTSTSDVEEKIFVKCTEQNMWSSFVTCCVCLLFNCLAINELNDQVNIVAKDFSGGKRSLRIKMRAQLKILRWRTMITRQDKTS